ncbi:hypothetical protein [Terricaulis silvestris]|uniref:Uncharacterized protein n=1 Tax=Terricaulis silvestris TaxID=2686094 RepID=A0A6I6MUJ7_9CAUL|nr:hypothetical protein [Terricaulis silvestris]QGZ97058.1 hypothetical protein DSM104635_03923 [Terricaulis silvestris]
MLKPSEGSGAAGSPQEMPEHVRITDNDHRPLGEFRTRYPASAWAQIVIELMVLLVYLSASIYGVGFILWDIEHAPTTPLEVRLSATAPWSGMFFAGIAGGTLFALKYLYHVVAKAEWNRDRVLWRFIAPINCGVLATGSGFGIASGIIPFIDESSFQNIYVALFYGFFIGHFSDNVLAALQRLALEWFGTVDATTKSRDDIR